ncbi:sensor histidine kinase [Filimonas effusa]|uniref:Signal transduction histidine kinase internal region domain-containing protein n=1 Tax=Filimonas effusa TaxID=2508721 RepID=A0A4Q1D8M2_9BACT|nr:histidine kinase [Filimonas effusa]RXK85694.1 hypothetical protein ESB13_02445 [Filimonas effusa]
MKAGNNHILPIALAVLLPGLNFFSNAELELPIAVLLKRWCYAAASLYILWHVIWLVSAYTSKKTRWFLLPAAILLSAFLLYQLLSLPVFFPHVAVRPLSFKVLSACLVILIIQYSLKASASIGHLQVEKEQLLAEKYKMQLQELRTRVDPHFLFNTLNTLRSMIRKGNPESERFVMNLSGFYRQTLRYNEAAVVLLKDEIDVLNAYLFLIKTRNEGAVQTSINIQVGWLQYALPALSLQVVTENCFKHNRQSAADPLQIEIFTTQEGCITVRNTLLPKFSMVEKSGYGLKNILTMYELLGVKDGLTVNQTNQYFEVTLKLIKP